MILDKLGELIENSPWTSIIDYLGYGNYSENGILPTHRILQKENYDEFLKSKYWKLVKELKEYTNDNCQLCGMQFSTKIYSNLHHNNYACHGYEHLKYCRNRFLTILCKDCHKLFHDNKCASQGW